MSNLVYILLGGFLIYLALNDQVRLFAEAVTKKPGKANVRPLNYMLAAALVSVPSLILEATEHEKEAWYYTGLILLSLIVFYHSEIGQFTRFITKEYRT